jgi:hypothetical protein
MVLTDRRVWRPNLFGGDRQGFANTSASTFSNRAKAQDTSGTPGSRMESFPAELVIGSNNLSYTNLHLSQTILDESGRRFWMQSVRKESGSFLVYEGEKRVWTSNPLLAFKRQP